MHLVEAAGSEGESKQAFTGCSGTLEAVSTVRQGPGCVRKEAAATSETVQLRPRPRRACDEQRLKELQRLDAGV